ncbi:MAG: hypothetical protein AAF567_24430 [Actinomycetota bacterium]
MTRWLACVAAALLLAAACASEGDSSASESTSAQSSDLKALHELEQDAIERCMLDAGFEFERWPFVPFDDQAAAPEDFLTLNTADTLGYRLLFSAIRNYTPSAIPPESALASQQTFDEFSVALWGPNDHTHEHDHDHDDTHTHGGCAASGAQVRRDADSIAGYGDRIGEVFDSVLSDTSYVEYSSMWVECLKEAGFEPRAATPDRQIVSYHIAEGRSVQAVVTELYENEDDDGPIHVAASQRLLDEAWLLSVTSNYTSLADLLDAEILEAQADQRCREEHREIIAPVVEQAYELHF